MKISALALMATISVVALAGCEERQNPLQKLESEQIAQWLNDRPPPLREQMNSCGVFWTEVSGGQYQADGRRDCNELASALAVEMSAAGFGKIHRDDLFLPVIWNGYLEKVKTRKMNVYDPEEAAKLAR